MSAPGSQPGLRELLACLVPEGELPDHRLHFRGFLLPGMSDQSIRLIHGHMCFEFCVDDILAVEQAALAPGAVPGVAPPVAVTLRAGARLLTVQAADPYLDLCGGRRPFLLAVREQLATSRSARFEVLEREFLADTAHAETSPS